MTTHAELSAEAKVLLARERQGVLSTHSVQFPGYPFGSLAPYALSGAGNPLLLISKLAVHTRNLEADPRCCLTVLEAGTREDPQTAGRLTLLGQATPVPPEAVEDATVRYLAAQPTATVSFGLGDFRLFELRVEQVRFVAGFGRMAWLPAADVVEAPAPLDPLQAARADILAHLNQDHPETLRELLHARGVEAEHPHAVGVDATGLDVRASTGGALHRIPFLAPVDQADGVRTALVELLKQARGRPA